MSHPRGAARTCPRNAPGRGVGRAAWVQEGAGREERGPDTTPPRCTTTRRAPRTPGTAGHRTCVGHALPPQGTAPWGRPPLAMHRGRAADTAEDTRSTHTACVSVYTLFYGLAGALSCPSRCLAAPAGHAALGWGRGPWESKAAAALPRVTLLRGSTSGSGRSLPVASDSLGSRGTTARNCPFSTYSRCAKDAEDREGGGVGGHVGAFPAADTVAGPAETSADAVMRSKTRRAARGAMKTREHTPARCGHVRRSASGDRGASAASIITSASTLRCAATSATPPSRDVAQATLHSWHTTQRARASRCGRSPVAPEAPTPRPPRRRRGKQRRRGRRRVKCNRARTHGARAQQRGFYCVIVFIRAHGLVSSATPPD